MAATKGRSLRVKVATTLGGVYATVVGIESASIDMDGQNVDVTTLTDADIVRIQAIKDCKVSMSGNYETDATGQGVIRSAYENDTGLFFQFLPDGATGWKAECKVAKYSISGATKDKLGVSIDLEGSGAKTTV
jgi:predicted secreted protein